MGELQSIVIFAIAAFILYIVAIVAISGWEIRQAKQAQGMTTITPYITKAFLYTLGWEFFVTLFFIALIALSPSGNTNPAVGIWAFWHIDWLSPDTLASLDGGKIASTGTEAQLASEKVLVLIMATVRFVYILLLMIFYAMMVAFAFSIPVNRAKVQGEEFDAGFAMMIFIAFVAASLAYSMVLGITSSLLEGLMSFAEKLHKASMPSGDFNIIEDLAAFVRLGIEVWGA
jgi:hypothetical protein